MTKYSTVIFALVLFLLFKYSKTEKQSGNSLLIIIRSQSNEYHNRIALEKKDNLDNQAQANDFDIKVLLLHKEWPVEAAWSILPIMADISRKYSDDFKWIMFIEDGTSIDIPGLINEILPKYNSEEELYIGRCLVDRDITIIHHFAFLNGGLDKFYYPDFQAGWLLSNSLVKKIADVWDHKKHGYNFQIDVQHEIAMFLNKDLNIQMSCSSRICGSSKNNDKCITSISHAIPDCGNDVTLNDVLISVKTTKMFHNTRVLVVKDTWGKYAKNIIYYSNVTDNSIPTVDCGVPNTERGHCGKMEVIINDAYHRNDLKKFSWLIIADDDSIIGLRQMVKLLNCYKSDIPIVLGERYGFGLSSEYGYSYITGGGSMVMSRGAINEWVNKGCKCPSIQTPDDMFLGQCFSFLVGIPVTHSPRFHQARPDDYSTGYLDNLQPVSFHKHWENNPIRVYNDFFANDDKEAFGHVDPNEKNDLTEPVFSKDEL